jgi:hypothetical protein
VWPRAQQSRCDLNHRLVGGRPVAVSNGWPAIGGYRVNKDTNTFHPIGQLVRGLSRLR